MTKKTEKDGLTPSERFFAFANSELETDMIPNVPDKDYFGNKDYLSKHSLEYLLESPQKFKAWKDGVLEEEETEAMVFGRALHCAVLTPSIFAETYAVAPICDRRTKAGKEAYAVFQEENAGKEIIPAEWNERISAMIESLHGNSLIESLLFDGDETNAELTALFRLGGGEIIKAKMDKLVNLGDEIIILDLKTAVNASHTLFARACVNFRYDMQAAIYCTAVAKHRCLGLQGIKDGRIRFATIAIEKKPPYACAIYFLDDWIIGGNNLASQAINLLRESVSSGYFAGYSVPDDILPVPAWHKP